MNILILLEDTPNDQHIAVPVVRALCAKRGITAKVRASQERLRSVEDATDPERLLPIIQTHQGMVELFILIVDRDCRAPDRPRGGDRASALANLEQKIAASGALGAGQRFITCQAIEELETWLLAAFDELPWQGVRDHCDPKEAYFEPLAEGRGLSENVGGGRQELMREALDRFKRIWQLCPELQQLAARI